jgi:hypothetical protein
MDGVNEIKKPIFDELQVGIISLGVPLEDDAVQIGLFMHMDVPMSRLIVTVEEGSIRLSREDGQELQIDDNDDPLGAPERRRRTRLLSRPVAELVLNRTSPLGGVWRIEGEELGITDLERFDKFLTQIFLFVYKKQNPRSKVADVMATLDQFREF